MCDLTNILIAARKKKRYRTLNAFASDFYSHISIIENCNVIGDVDCGERWVWVPEVGMFHTEVGVCFILEKYAETFKNFFDIAIVTVPDFDEQIWSIDLEHLKHEVPEIQWAASDKAVNPNCFSTQELYYATV